VFSMLPLDTEAPASLAKVLMTKPLREYTPRACDCNFCRMHGAAYISDAKGELNIQIRSDEEVSIYRQGDKLVELLICKKCGVLVAVTYTDNGNRFGGLNSSTLANRGNLQASETASPKLLSRDEKIVRWKQLWFPEVTITNLP